MNIKALLPVLLAVISLAPSGTFAATGTITGGQLQAIINQEELITNNLKTLQTYTQQLVMAVQSNPSGTQVPEWTNIQTLTGLPLTKNVTNLIYVDFANANIGPPITTTEANFEGGLTTYGVVSIPHVSAPSPISQTDVLNLLTAGTTMLSTNYQLEIYFSQLPGINVQLAEQAVVLQQIITDEQALLTAAGN